MRRAARERLARAVREKGKDKVEHSADDDLCVICQDTTVDAVEVSVLEVTHSLKNELRFLCNSLTSQRIEFFEYACNCRNFGDKFPNSFTSNPSLSTVEPGTHCKAQPNPHRSTTAAMWPRVLQSVRGGAAPERRGQILPPLPHATATRAGEAIRSGVWHVQEDPK